VQDIDRLEDAEQVRDSEHLVNVQDLILWVLLHLVKRAIGDPAEQHLRILVAYLPYLHHIKEHDERR